MPKPSPTTGGHRLTLRAIEVFVAVIEEGSLGAAARRLSASPSAISQQLSNLETAVGAPLVERATRPLSLTSAGHVFAPRALAILSEAERARVDLATLELARLRQLRLAIVEDLDGGTTPELIAKLARRLPGCEIVTRSGPSHENLHALGQRSVNVVVAAEADDVVPDWVERRPLLRDPYVLVAEQGLASAEGDLTSRLMAAPMIRFSEDLFIGRQTERHLRRQRITPPRTVSCDSTLALLGAVERLGGWALITPLCWLRARRFHGSGALELRPNPFRAYARRVSVMARRGTLGGLPSEIADTLRNLLRSDAVSPGLAAAPWLGDALRILEDEPDADYAIGCVAESP